MIQQRFSPADELQRAAEVLFRDWQLALPTAVGSLVVTLIFVVGVIGAFGTSLLGLATGSHAGAGMGILTAVLLMLAIIPVAIILTLLTQAIVVAETGEAWAGRRFNFGRGFATVMRRLGELAPVVLLLAVVMSVLALLCIVLVGIPLIVLFGYFTIYVLPAVLVGGEGIGQAFATSYRLARTFIGETAVAYLAVVLVSVGGGMCNAMVSHVPLVNFVAGFAIGGLTAAYGALVITRFYELLRNAAPATDGFAFVPPAPPQPPAL